MTAPTWLGLMIAALPVLAVMVFLSLFRLGQVRPLVISLVRLVVQMMFLGWVLDGLFRIQNPWLVVAVASVMLVASAQVVTARQRRSGWELRFEAFGSMALSVALVLAVSVRMALRIEPWYDSRTVIPLLGMILGNSATGVSLACERLDGEIRSERDRIELLLTLGATRHQAARPAMRAAVRAGLTPIINNMMIAGIVAIPGMATGQILAGAAVADAVRYQILIYLGIAGTVGLSILLLVTLRLRHYFTKSDQLRGEILDDTARPLR